MKTFGWVIWVLLCTSCSEKKLFKLANSTGITFSNQLTETEDWNILTYEYFYNGGGLSAGDFNNDGLVDLYFSGNQVKNELYINQGHLKFQKVEAGISGRAASWKTGVSLVDINQDGWLDIYLCYSGIGLNKKNELYINQGAENGTWKARFIEKAEDYGIADTGYTTQAAFLDFDADGDQDLFVLNHNLKDYQRKEAAQMKSSIDSLAGDKFYENKNGKFVDVTTKVGIKSNPLGFGLGVSVADFNGDLALDIYVANDYVEEDYLYLNNQKGGFVESGKKSFGHFSYSSMGTDAQDFNNDGQIDLVTADMLPEDSKRQKLLAFPDNWNVQESMIQNGFHWQNMRNMLQLNKGTVSSIPMFSEIGQLAGIAATDWSWSPLLADFDGDGLKDLFVSNGFVRDLTDLDFVKYYSDLLSKKEQGQTTESFLDQVEKMPKTPTHHYVYKNSNGWQFVDQTTSWGLEQNTVAAGAVAVDLDNDGDLEIVTNNTNETAKIYENQLDPDQYVKISPQEALISITVGNQTVQCHPVHGFQSSVVAPYIFYNPASFATLKYSNGAESRIAIHSQQIVPPKPTKGIWAEQKITENLLEREISVYEDKSDFNDFAKQILLPKRLSNSGVPIVPYKDDLFFVGGSKGQNHAIYSTKKPNFRIEISKRHLQSKAIHAVFFDADGDHDHDLYVLNGGYEQPLEGPESEDELYIYHDNQWVLATNQIPNIRTNKSKVLVVDFDKDKDQDLLILGGVRAGLFPYSDPSYVFTNNGRGTFTASPKMELGLVSDGLVYQNSLVTVGYFDGVYKYDFSSDTLTHKTELFANSTGLWQSILATGNDEFLLGNIGENTSLKANSEAPIQIAWGDADGNGLLDLIIGQYFGNKLYPIYGRDELLEQSFALKKIFTSYLDYALATLDKIFDLERLENKEIKELRSGRMKINGVFVPLPPEAQISNVTKFVSYKGQYLVLGNESGNRIRIGKQDAQYGSWLNLETGTMQNAHLWINDPIKHASIIGGKLVVSTDTGTIKIYKLP